MRINELGYKIKSSMGYHKIKGNAFSIKRMGSGHTTKW